MINVHGFQYKLKVVTDAGAKNEQAIAGFIKNLCAPEALASEIEDTKVLSKRKNGNNNQDLVSYTIDCFFKTDYLEPEDEDS